MCQAIRRLSIYDTDALIRVLELHEDRLYAGLVAGSIAVVQEDLEGRRVRQGTAGRDQRRAARLREPLRGRVAYLGQV